jgi:hypothetical protein
MGLAEYAGDPISMDKSLMDGVVGARLRLEKDESPYVPESSEG